MAAAFDVYHAPVYTLAPLRASGSLPAPPFSLNVHDPSCFSADDAISVRSKWTATTAKEKAAADMTLGMEGTT